MKKRVISAVVMLAVAFACVFLSPVSRVLFFAAAGILCAYELSHNYEKLNVYCGAWVMFVYIGAQALPLAARHWLAGACAAAGLVCVSLVKPVENS